jgi:RNA polymerase sigma factor (sigma-70 family)
MKGRRSEAETRTAVEEAYRKESAGLLARAKRASRDILDAEDALQDAFVGALGNLGALAAVENIPGWLFASLRNRLIDLWRRRATRRRAGETDVSFETLEEIAVAAGMSLEDSLAREALAEALAIALGALPREQREVVEAQALEGLSFRELSERTGESINTLMARKRRAVSRLASALRDWAGR